MKKQSKKRKVDYSKVRGLLMLVVAFGLIIQFSIRSYSVISKQNEKMSAVTAQKEELEKQKADLEQELNLLNNDDYVTRYARENYVFTKDGETVVILPQKDQENGE